MPIEDRPAAGPWKIAIAARERHHDVPYRWIGHKLQMDITYALRVDILRFRDRRSP